MDRRCFLRCVAGQLLLVACSQSKTTTSASSGPTSTPVTPALPVTTVPAPSTSAAPVATTTTLPSAEVPGGLVRRLDTPKSSIFAKYDDGIPEEWLQLVAETLSVSQTDIGDSGPLTYHTYSSPDIFVPVYAKFRVTSEDAIRAALPTTRSIGLLGHIWQYYPNVRIGVGPNPPVAHLHEYLHTYQGWLSKRESRNAPLWLLEGTADYYSFKVGTDRGYAPRGNSANFDSVASRRIGPAQRSWPPLSTFEKQNGSNNEAYSLGFVATAYLGDKYGDKKVHDDIWAAMKPGKDWSEAFSEVFGITSGDFYAEFEQYRKTL